MERAKQPCRGRRGATAGFTLIELLAVIAILSVLAIVAIPQLLGARTKAVLKEAQANIMNIAGEVERFYADGNFSYSTGAATGFCPGSVNYTGAGTQIGTFPVAIQGDYYQYTIATTDVDSDTLCEAYTITATGIRTPATSQANLTYNQIGVKGGPWR